MKLIFKPVILTIMNYSAKVYVPYLFSYFLTGKIELYGLFTLFWLCCSCTNKFVKYLLASTLVLVRYVI